MQLLAVCVDNSEKSNVYPQTADFTLCWRNYRDVNLIVTPQTHFELEHWGADGVSVSAKTDGTVFLHGYVRTLKKGTVYSLRFWMLWETWWQKALRKHKKFMRNGPDDSTGSLMAGCERSLFISSGGPDCAAQ